jgi:predicted ATPase
MEWDDVRLSVAERTLLARLSVFPGGFGVAAAEAVGAGGDVAPGQVLELLRGLVDKSLVVTESTPCAARFRLSQTVRSYAAERLQEIGSTGALVERHAEWCLALVEAEHLKAARLLTPAEGKVAALAAQGLANAVIARELVLSRRTVETHLQRAYAKLGISSRKQLPAYVRTEEEGIRSQSQLHT